MEIVVGGLIAIINQGLLYWRIQQLKRKDVRNPGKIIDLARISLLERLMLVGFLLVLAMQQLDPLSVILSFFLINLSLIYYLQWHLKP